MATLSSSSFTVIVNRSTSTSAIGTTTIQVSKGEIALVGVGSNPGEGQFSFVITSCTGCTASKLGYDQVQINSITLDNATVLITINAEGKSTYNKIITVVKAKQGEDGEKGQSLVSSTPQWYLSTSNTTQENGEWVETMPTITEGYYLWLRYKLDWENPTAITYSTPTLEQIGEAVKEVTAKQVTLQQDLDGFKTTVSETYLSQEDASNTYATSSELTQTSTDLTAMFNNGYSQGITQINAEGVKVYHNSIDGENYTHMSPTGFYIKYQGDDILILDENGLVLKGTITDYVTVSNEVNAGIITCEKLNVPWHDRCLTRNTTVYIDSSYSYETDLDESYFDDGVTFASFADLMSVAPRNLNNYILDVYFNSDLNEKINCNVFHSGRLRVNMWGHTLQGYMRFFGIGLKTLVYGDAVGYTKNYKRGIIMPGSVGYLYGASYRCGIHVDDCEFTCYDLDMYAGTSTDYDTVGIICSNGCRGYVSNVKAVNNVRTLVRINAMSHVYVESSSGTTSSNSFQAVSGSIMHLNTTTQAGRSGSTAYTYTSGNAQIFADGVTWDGTAQTGDNTNNDTVTTTTVTKTITSDTGRSWRTSGSYANSWSSDVIVRQGQWTSSLGMNRGYWFFGNDIYNILQDSSNTITSIKVKITRNSGGQNASVTHYLRCHTIANKPSGTPSSFVSDSTFSHSFSLAVGNSTTITLSSSEISALKSSGAKGFGIYTSSTSNSSYSCCSATMTVTITYTTTA